MPTTCSAAKWPRRSRAADTADAATRRIARLHRTTPTPGGQDASGTRAGYLATWKGQKVRFTAVTDRVLTRETAQGQRRLKEAMHLAVNLYELLIEDEIGY